MEKDFKKKSKLLPKVVDTSDFFQKRIRKKYLNHTLIDLVVKDLTNSEVIGVTSYIYFSISIQSFPSYLTF